MPTPPTTPLITSDGTRPSGGRPVSTGSCLGLERDERCRQAGLAALLGAPATPDALERALAAAWGHGVAIAPIAAVEPLAVLGASMAPGDVGLVAPTVAARCRGALAEARAAGRVLEVAPADAAAALARLEALGARGARVWYVADTLDGRTGARAPLEALGALQARLGGLHLLLDDTQGLGWHGRGGCGLALADAPAAARLVVVADLSRGLGAELGVVASPDAGLLAAARPIFAPGALDAVRVGAAVGMATFPAAEWEAMQGRLQKRLLLTDRLLRAHGLPHLGEPEVPLRFVAAHAPAVAYAVAGRLLEAGHAVGVAVCQTPSGPQAAVRFSVSLAQPLEALQGLLEALARALSEALEAAGTSLDALRRAQGPAAPGPAGVPIDLAAWRASRLSGPRGARTPG